MPYTAHQFYVDHLDEPCTNALETIREQFDPDLWYGECEDVEWESRDGFLSSNNGGIEFCSSGNMTSLYFNGCPNPHIQTMLDKSHDELYEEASEDEKYLEYIKATPDGSVSKWLEDTEDGRRFEEYYFVCLDESPAFLKGHFYFKGADFRQHRGPVDENTEFVLICAVCYNDDYSYGRPWCQGGYYGSEGFGDRLFYEKTIHFTPKDLEWVINEIHRIPDEVKSTDDSVELPHGYTNDVYSPSLSK